MADVSMWTVMMYWIISFPLTVTILQCPLIKYAERGTQSIVNCSIDSVGYVYWYKDKVQRPVPLVKIEDGKKYVLDGNTGQFDISDDGCLIIRNVTEEEFGTYDILHIRKNNAVENATTELKVAKRPTQSCPLITGCEDCQYCLVDGQSNQKIRCTVTESRPKVHLSFEVVGEHLYSVTNFSIIEHYDSSMDTWNTTSIIDVISSPCSTSMNFRCSVIGQNLFQLADSYAEFKTAICSTTKPYSSRQTPEESAFSLPIIAFVVVLATTFLILLCVICFCVYFYKRNRTKHRAKRRNTDTPPTEVPLIQNKPRRHGAGNSISKDTGVLLRHLKELYLQLSYVTLLPLEQKIHINKLYTASNFCLTKPDGGTQKYTSTDFLTCKESDVVQRVLLIGDVGYGKTIFCRYVASKWLEEIDRHNQMILFILPLKETHLHMGIAQALYETIPTDLNINLKSIVSLLKNRKCRIILDGLKEFKSSLDIPVQSQSSNLLYGDVPIQRLLQQATLKTYPKLELWITSRDPNVNISKTYTKIMMENLTTEQMIEYTTKACNYYFSNIKSVKRTEENDALQNACGDEQMHADTEEDNNIHLKTVSDKVEYVKKTIQDSDFISEFSSSPLLMIMFIHMIASDEIPLENSKFEINLFSSVVGSVVSCLEGRCIKNPNMKINAEELCKVREGLSQLSLVDKSTLVSDWRLADVIEQLSPEYVNVAIDIGFLKSTKPDNSTSISTSHVTFFHPYIQEYFIAEHICRNDDFEDFFKKYTADKIVGQRIRRILQLLCNQDNPVVKKILRFLAEKKLWDVVIDCFHESSREAQDNLLETIPSTWGRESLGYPRVAMVIKDVHRTYHQKALMSFCNLSCEKKIAFKSMTLICSAKDSKNDNLPEKKFSLFNEAFSLPKMDELIIREAFIENENSFLNLLKATSYYNELKVPNIRFQQCRLPKQIMNLEKLKEVTNFITLSVTRCDNEDSKLSEHLDFEKGTWI